MFYFHDPLMNTVPPSVTPPAMSRVVEIPVSPLAPPKGWQWANSKSSSAVAPGTVAPGTVAGGDEARGKKSAFSSPSTHAPLPTSPCAVSSAARASQPPKGYVEWTTSQPPKGRQTVTIQPHVVAAQPPLAPAPTWIIVSWKHPAPAPTWSIVSWKHLAPRKFTGTKEEVIALVENDLAAAGIHHLDVQVYSAIHVIVALKA